MATLALDEQETNYTVEATDRKIVRVFSNDPVVQRQIERLGIVADSGDGYGKFYKVDLNQFSFGIRRKRQVSEAQRQAAADLFATYRNGVDEDNEDAYDDMEVAA